MTTTEQLIAAIKADEEKSPGGEYEVPDGRFLPAVEAIVYLREFAAASPEPARRGRKPKGSSAMTGAERQAARMKRLRRIEKAAMALAEENPMLVSRLVLDVKDEKAVQWARLLTDLAVACQED